MQSCREVRAREEPDHAGVPSARVSYLSDGKVGVRKATGPLGHWQPPRQIAEDALDCQRARRLGHDRAKR